MSDGQEDVSSQPLVIVRRRRNTEETHHGGVWKIAYADFMTAMMAFFLVMWLINAADKKTIVQVAAYFNPMRLTDRNATPKGLDDLTEMEAKQVEEKTGKTGLPNHTAEKRKIDAEHPAEPKRGEALDEAAQKLSAAAGGKSDEAQKEEALFDNPGTLLDTLAKEAKANQILAAANPSEGKPRDPFDRTAHEKQFNASNTPAQIVQMDGRNEPSSGVEAAGVKTRPPNEKRSAAPTVTPAQNAQADPGKEASSAKEAGSDKTRAEPVPGIKPGTIDKDAKAKKIAADISSALSKVSRSLPNVEVKSTSEGLLVSLLDDATFGMFEVGSAKPRADLVLVMDKIGEVLKSQDGDIVIRGHTDSRAYRNGNYDNWRLSASRAQMAHYMLVRAGIPESRFVAIEGRADRDPKVPSDTTAAQNRRIDILIREASR